MRSRPSPFLAPLVAALCVALSGCGTDILGLLKRDSALVAKADEIAAAADAIDPELATEMYDAEDAKRRACETIYQSISEQMTRRPSFSDDLESDVGAVRRLHGADRGDRTLRPGASRVWKGGRATAEPRAGTCRCSHQHPQSQQMTCD
jgi:hypothetical protein